MRHAKKFVGIISRRIIIVGRCGTLGISPCLYVEARSAFNSLQGNLEPPAPSSLAREIFFPPITRSVPHFIQLESPKLFFGTEEYPYAKMFLEEEIVTNLWRKRRRIFLTIRRRFISTFDARKNMFKPPPFFPEFYLELLNKIFSFGFRVPLQLRLPLKSSAWKFYSSPFYRRSTANKIGYF